MDGNGGTGIPGGMPALTLSPGDEAGRGVVNVVPGIGGRSGSGCLINLEDLGGIAGSPVLLLLEEVALVTSFAPAAVAVAVLPVVPLPPVLDDVKAVVGSSAVFDRFKFRGGRS